MHEFIIPSIGGAVLAALSIGVGYLIGFATAQAAVKRAMESVRALEQRTLGRASNHRIRLRDVCRLLESERGSEGVARALVQLLELDSEILREFLAIKRNPACPKAVASQRRIEPRQADPPHREQAPQAEGNEAGEAPTSNDLRLSPTDCRQEIRHCCRVTHLIAPYDNGRLPTRDQFQAYEGRDISSKGFSFAATSPPSFSSLVVAIGQPPKLTYLTARVANVAEAHENGRRYHRIGCAFTGRLHNSLFE